MAAVGSLARHTFLDAFRERAFLVLGIYGLVMLGASRLISPLALGEGRRVTIDLGLGGVALFGFLLIALLGTRMVHKEIDSKTILMILAKPIRRGEFILGKFFGLIAVVGVSLIGMTILLAGILALSRYSFDATLLIASYYAFLELVIVAAVAMLLTAFTSPVLATFFLLGLFIVGHLSSSLIDLAQMLPSPATGYLLKGLFFILPRFDLFSFTLEVVHGMPIAATAVLWATLYAGVYSAGALLIAILAFRGREFS